MPRLRNFSCALALSFATSAFAQFPERPITMIVPFPPGGVADTVARPMAEALSREVHRPGRAVDGSEYFDCWVAALSSLLSERGVASEAEQSALSDRWARAAEATPHGKPILLENAD